MKIQDMDEAEILQTTSQDLRVFARSAGAIDDDFCLEIRQDAPDLGLVVLVGLAIGFVVPVLALSKNALASSKVFELPHHQISCFPNSSPLSLSL
jgi:hypothetical protein